MGKMPGLMKGIGYLKTDESRHIGYGTYLLQRLICEHPRLFDVVSQKNGRARSTFLRTHPGRIRRTAGKPVRRDNARDDTVFIETVPGADGRAGQGRTPDDRTDKHQSFHRHRTICNGNTGRIGIPVFLTLTWDPARLLARPRQNLRSARSVESSDREPPDTREPSSKSICFALPAACFPNWRWAAERQVPES